MQGEPEAGLAFDCAVKNKKPVAKTITTERTEEQCAWWLAQLPIIYQSMQTGVFPPGQVGWWCSPKFCGYWDLCHKDAKTITYGQEVESPF
jgi:hypothetical protein